MVILNGVGISIRIKRIILYFRNWQGDIKFDKIITEKEGEKLWQLKQAILKQV